MNGLTFRACLILSLALSAVAYCAPRGPLGKIEVLGLLAGGTSANEVARDVQRKGINFTAGPKFLSMLQMAESSDDQGKADLATALTNARVVEQTVARPASESEILQDLLAGAQAVVKHYPPTREGWAAAVPNYQRALKLAPDNPVLQFDVAAALGGQGEFASAIPYARRALKAMPDVAAAHMMLGEALGGSGRVTEAIAELREAVRIDPGADSARAALAQALVGSHDPSGALEAMRQGIDAQPNDPALHNSLGTILFEVGHVDGAIAEFRRALALGSQDPELHVDLADALRRKGDVNGAIQELRTANGLDPNIYQAHYMLAEALIDSHKLSEAKVELQEVIRLEPNYALAHSELGFVFRHEHDLKGAIAEYGVAVRLDPKLAVAHYNLATALYRDHQRGAAYQEILIAHRLEPNNPSFTKAFNRLPKKYKRMAARPPYVPKPRLTPTGEPPRIDFVYFQGPQSGELTPLEAETPSMKFKAHLFSGTVYVAVPGGRSPVRLESGSAWRFLIRASDPTQLLSFGLGRFESGPSGRKLTFKKKVVPPNNSGQPGRLDFSAHRYGKMSFQLVIPGDLAPGEYGFLVSISGGSPEAFCFGVDAP